MKQTIQIAAGIILGSLATAGIALAVYKPLINYVFNMELRDEIEEDED